LRFLRIHGIVEQYSCT